MFFIGGRRWAAGVAGEGGCLASLKLFVREMNAVWERGMVGHKRAQRAQRKRAEGRFFSRQDAKTRSRRAGGTTEVRTGLHDGHDAAARRRYRESRDSAKDWQNA